MTPFVIIEQTPVQVSEHLNAVGHSVRQMLEGLLRVVNAACVIGRGYATFGDNYRQIKLLRQCVG